MKGERILAILRARPVRIALTFLLTSLLATLLVSTIFWSRFDLQWLAFLGGVLFAAVLAIASQASKAEWLAQRRSRQLERSRELLGQEAARSRNATEAMRMLESRIQLLSNAIPSPILFVDRDGTCRAHNRAVERKLRLPGDRITGRPLREVVGGAIYGAMAPHIAETLTGKPVSYPIAWESPGTAEHGYTVRHVPYPPDNPNPLGFYLVATAASPAQLTAPRGASPARAAAGAPPGARDDGDVLFVKLFSDELTGWDDPRAGVLRALEEDQFLLYTQKILALKSDAPDPFCYEVLLRLREEEEFMLPPGNFIPIVESCGLMEHLDRWVVRKLISWCAEKRRLNPSWRVPLFCVNLSGSAVTSPSFSRFVTEELQRTGFDPRALCFEIGEEDIINRNAEVRQFMEQLKPAGCRFAADAFGSVKVSFAHLKGLPIDFVKIDGTLVQSMLRDPAGLAKVRGIHTVCRTVGIRTVAKFVETPETLNKLRELGLDYVQGFAIARPGPIDKAVQDIPSKPAP